MSSSSLGRHSPLTVGVSDPPNLISLSPAASFGNSNGAPSSPGVSSNSYMIGSSGANIFNSSSNNSATSSNTVPSTYPPNHPLSGSKHLCSICEDKASGKHYGVYSCEGCKGFFKRTVRKELVYSCREHKSCIIDKRQRNRCQYCRYKKCLEMGMKREAVQELRTSKYHLQEERQRTKEKPDHIETFQQNDVVHDMPIHVIREAEMLQDIPDSMQYDMKPDMAKYCQAAKDQMEQVVRWAKLIPHFVSLSLKDQMVLLKAGWNELLIAAFSHRSINVDDAIVLANGVRVDRNTMQDYGLDSIFDRVLSELVTKMREMKVDQAELGCLRTIVLYNPDAKSLTNVQHVEALREKVYSTLEDYTKSTYPKEPGRFPKLLLRLPSLRSIGLKCTEHLFFLKDWGNYPKLLDTPIDKYLLSLLDDTNLGSTIAL